VDHNSVFVCSFGWRGIHWTSCRAESGNAAESSGHQAIAMNKQALAQYTWVEQHTIRLKGEQKKQEHFQGQMGHEGKPKRLPWIRLPLRIKEGTRAV